MRPDNDERSYAQRLVSRISELAGVRGPKHCVEENPRKRESTNSAAYADYGVAKHWRFDWSKTCRSKYTPHTGAKQRAAHG